MRILALLALAAALAACKNVAPVADQPAVIVEPTDASRQALKRVVDEALGTDVLLADDALTATSMLTIERSMPQSLQGSPAEGRRMDPPIQFRLVTNGSDCILIDTRSGSRYRLADTACSAE